jgi:midasin (ATPase involved in ribosome maturation)
MTVVLCSLSFLLVEYFPRVENKFLSLLRFIPILAISLYAANKIGTAKIKVIFTSEAIIHIWERRFILSWESDIKIPWDIVDNYVFQNDRTFDSFIINLKNNKRYKIDRQNMFPVKDDFKKLVKEFPRLSNDYRNREVSDNYKFKIIAGKSIYESKSFRWSFYLLLTGFIFLVFIKVFTPDSGSTWGILVSLGSAILFYGTMMQRQKNKN